MFEFGIDLIFVIELDFSVLWFVFLSPLKKCALRNCMKVKEGNAFKGLTV